jgi:hypothetical protein
MTTSAAPNPNLNALQHAAQAGIADVKAGRTKSFNSKDEVDQHFNAIATGAIKAEQQSSS